MTKLYELQIVLQKCSASKKLQLDENAKYKLEKKDHKEHGTFVSDDVILHRQNVWMNSMMIVL